MLFSISQNLPQNYFLIKYFFWFKKNGLCERFSLTGRKTGSIELQTVSGRQHVLVTEVRKRGYALGWNEMRRLYHDATPRSSSSPSVRFISHNISTNTYRTFSLDFKESLKVQVLNLYVTLVLRFIKLTLWPVRKDYLFIINMFVLLVSCMGTTPTKVLFIST